VARLLALAADLGPGRRRCERGVSCRPDREAALTDEDATRLIEAARAASRNAYCPYSGFAVGAALLTRDGRVFTGCNVENASYGLTVCAERNAVAQMVTAGGRGIAAVVIFSPSATPPRPCGACRQVLSELGPDAEVIAVCDGDDRLESTVSSLLPEAFGPSALEREHGGGGDGGP
jgi:cytidine deaminase